MNKYNYTTLCELYEYSVHHYANKQVSSTFKGEGMSYGAFARKVEKLTSIMSLSGLEKGDKVAILSQNLPHWAVVYFAVTTTGRVAVPLLTDFSECEIEIILQHSEAKAIFVSKKLLPKLTDTIKQQFKLIVCIDDFSVLYAAPENQKATPANVETNDLAVIIYTSGTTGTPKGVMLSHRNLCRQLNMVFDIQKMDESDVLLSILPLPHTYECSLGMLLPFMTGAEVVYLDKLPTPNVLLPALKEVRPTMMLSVPLIMEKVFRNSILPKFTASAFMRRIYAIPAFRKVLHRIAGRKLYKTFGGRLHFFGIGGAKTDPVIEQFLMEAKFPYAIGYGLTETAPLLTAAVPWKTKWQSAGPAITGVDLRIDHPNAATGEGEIVVKGDNVMMGYYKNPEATQEVFTPDGWFRTKDLGVLDKHNRVYIKGRLNNMILGPSGENIYPEEIESVINGHAMVQESLVQENKGKLVALVHFNYEKLEQWKAETYESMNEKIEMLKQELYIYVNTRVNKFSRITLVVEQPRSFEKTPTQKIKRYLYN